MCTRMKQDPYLPLPQNKNYFRGFSVSSEVMKLLENTDKTPEDTGLGNSFWKRTPGAQDAIPRLDKWREMKSKSLCTAKERAPQLMAWERTGA